MFLSYLACEGVILEIRQKKRAPRTEEEMLTPPPVSNRLKYKSMSVFYSGNRLLVGTCKVHECFCSCMGFVISKMPTLHLNQPRVLLFHTHNYATH